MSDLTENEARLAAKLLRVASEKFGDHRCNDFDLEAVMPDIGERRRLNRAFHEYNGDPEEYDPDFLHLPDFALMGYIAFRLDPNGEERTGR